MKNAILVAAMLLGSVAFAAEGTAPATPVAKMSKKEAKKECLKENKDLKGAKLAECVKGKTSM